MSAKCQKRTFCRLTQGFEFVPNSSGKKLVPYVTVGVAPPDYLKEMVAEPFDAFTFSPVASSVYQLGNFGTARKKLKAWELKPYAPRLSALGH